MLIPHEFILKTVEILGMIKTGISIETADSRAVTGQNCSYFFRMWSKIKGVEELTVYPITKYTFNNI
jgi:hypothetical protein